MTTPQSATVQVHCRLTVRVDDPAAITELAVQHLRAVSIDWDDEEDDLESAAAELGDDLLRSIASLADPDRLLANVPGVEVTGAHVWAESAR
ncbi:hypothetical protein [Micromonospora radicis]|uniref:Uncharacterized protein n=1 Tax=Micromonospora radicis TaxID=1894971 RepID=A0A418MYA6_9ACTN|nr:hypothetical protein [Micromonospora radicis]RIV40004.1 hypothetical protein D2L64_06660 [Micromonospora radicis]